MRFLPKRIQDRILSKKKRLDRHRPLPPELVEQLRSSLLVDYTYSSNAIEGNTLNLGETRMVIEEGVTIGGKTFREHLEARNHPHAVTFLEELTRSDTLTPHDVLRLHRLVMDGVSPQAGEYRGWGVRISGASFGPPLSVDVPSLVESLLTWLHGNLDELSPVELAALLMHRFSQIHPFTDGNGRVGRLLMNLVLIRAGYPFITTITYRDRARYLRSLQEADEGDPRRLVALVARSVENALDVYLNALEEPKLLALSEAGRRIGVDADYLGLLARRGILPAQKKGGRWLVSEQDLLFYVEHVKRKP